MALDSKVFLTCRGCGRTSTPAVRAAETRVLAEADGWLVGQIGHKRVAGWEDDYCPACAPDHPRYHCEGPAIGPQEGTLCDRKALVMISRAGANGQTRVFACGSHAWVLEKEMLSAGNGTVEVSLTPA